MASPEFRAGACQIFVSNKLGDSAKAFLIKQPSAYSKVFFLITLISESMKSIYLLFFILISQSLFGQWTEQDSFGAPSFGDIYFWNDSEGIIVGQFLQILQTNDGGEEWDQQSLGTTEWFRKMHFLDENLGYAVGFGATGVMYKTNDGGDSWEVVECGASNPLYDVFFTTEEKGFAVGISSGRKTIDGGASWTTLSITGTSGATSTLDVYFFNEDLGFVVGWNGLIRKTTDGGTSWTASTSGTSSKLSSIFFTSLLNGYIVGEAGIILRTTDGGETWDSLDSGIASDLYCVHFTSENVGYAVGAEGMILVTTNAGLSWFVESSPTTNALTSIYFPSVSVGYICGQNTTILKTTNGYTWHEEKYSSAEIQIYPNPMAESATLKLPSGIFQVQLFNSLGQKVNEWNNVQNTLQITNENLSSGAYMVRVMNEQGISGEVMMVVR